MDGLNLRCGSKRKASEAPMGRPAKVRRTLDLFWGNQNSSASTHVQGGSSGDTLGMSNELVSPFGKRLVAAMSLSSENEKEEGPDAAVLDVYVPAAGFTIPISWGLILNRICETMGLAILKRDVIDGLNGGFCGLIEMEVPGITIYPTKKHQVFYGDDTVFRCDAEESASENAVSYLRKYCGVVIKDANYMKVKDLENRASRAEFFMNYFEDELARKDKRVSTVKERMSEGLNAIKKASADLVDVLSIGSVTVVDPMYGNGIEKVLFTTTASANQVVAKYARALIAAINKATASVSEAA